MNKVHNVLSVSQQSELIATQRPTTVSRSFTAQQHDSSSTTYTTPEPKQRTRVRKPSPGLAARLQALGFGKESIKSEARLSTHDRIGRIPEAHINRIDSFHRANSTPPIQPRGRTWSGNSGHPKPQRTHRSYTDFAISDPRMLQVSKHQSLPAAVSPELIPNDYNQQELDLQQIHQFHESLDVREDEEEDKDDKEDKDDQDDNSTSETSIIKSALSDKFTSPGSTLQARRKDISSESGRSSHSVTESTSYFNPLGSQRSGSIYTLSRVSFASQLAQLTSLQLPDAESLSSKVEAIPTSLGALNALMSAAEQIRSWISKASEVISGLDSEDDVEWAAAGGRDGLEEVDNAILRFEKLINVYVTAIDSLQARSDISSVSQEDHAILISQLEVTVSEWTKTKNTLKDVKTSVEIAMEWEELWNTVLGDIGVEMEMLRKLVFEMEEKRHKSVTKVDDSTLGLADLETIAEETSLSNSNGRFDLSFILSPITPNSPNRPEPLQDDSSLLALFARMQPLRASLDFFPMRLSAFLSRAKKIFPTACGELATKLNDLEIRWKTLEKDADSLRKELGEDRWVLVFRVAGGQAQKMYNSVERSFLLLKDSIQDGSHVENTLSLCKRFEKKRAHFGQAVERVLSIIDQGIKERLTVNGEILLLHSEMQRKWDSLKKQISEFDSDLAEFLTDKKKNRTRESMSSLVSNDQSTPSSLYGTPHSSPASSVIVASQRSNIDSTPLAKPKSRSRSSLPQPGVRRKSLSIGTTSLPQNGSSSRSSTHNLIPASTPIGNRPLKTSTSQNFDGKPRWNTSTKITDGIVGHSYKPLSLINPSPNPTTTPSKRSAVHSKIPMRSPLSRGNEQLSVCEFTPSRPSNLRLSLRERLVERISISTPTRTSPQNFSQSFPIRSQTQPYTEKSPSNVSRSSIGLPAESPDHTPSRSSRTKTPNGSNKRASLLPLPRRK
ncbi:hypothetical protein K3495_g2367 [Podosphaera aphanis]|nr:hypothetical protein K3495_g2367 [Podosphaera aphanis]